ncbi:cellulose binding domain-containing protein [Phytohabitans kaempferiae]|uniref:Cellulose binding domain-containing protein n=1 Tax=Phytohabitans kaempferiae TaxID=1620943 RepID=A0ABV6M2D2_9ACTN
MRLSAVPLPRIAAIAAAVIVALGTITVLPAPAHAATAAFVKESQWSTGYVGKLTVTNDSAATITSWQVTFDLPAGTTLGSYWNARMTRDGSRFVFANLPWNGTLAAGAATSFGWVASGGGEPQGCTVNGSPCSGAPPAPDVTPPSTPTNVRLGGSGGTVTITWDPSTDDTGVVGYQIFHRTNLITTVTAPTYTMPVPPPMVTTFGVRAVDAAGNLSPFTPVHFGQMPDSTPPTAPANLRFGGLGNTSHLRISWDAATDETFVVGYEVYLNGVLVTKVGGSPAYVPFHGFGTYMVRVRAWDPSGNFGPYAQIGLAVDPPPPPPSTPPAR